MKDVRPEAFDILRFRVVLCVQNNLRLKPLCHFSRLTVLGGADDGVELFRCCHSDMIMPGRSVRHVSKGQNLLTCYRD